MKVVVTGADGFLGWHTRARLLARQVDGEDIDVVPVTRATFTPDALARAVRGAEVVLHCAGLNRGDGDEVFAGNVDLARRLVAALDENPGTAPAVVVAGSSQADDDHPARDTPYGRGKRAAGAELSAWADRTPGASAADLRFPGLFGEHGRPDYNSFVATFAHRVARGEEPRVQSDREVPLLHVGEAVQRMFGAAGRRASGTITQPGRPTRISDVARRLREMHDVYAPVGEIPALTGGFDVALFNTLRAAMWPAAYPFRPAPRQDERGTLVETVRVHGGSGQAFLSTTNPGYTRGDHVHLHKIERFQVVAGRGLIRLRRVLHDEVLEFEVDGREPAVVDMPALWTHSITNIGTEPLVTSFWTNELFDPEHPDTYPLPVLTGRDLEDRRASGGPMIQEER